MSVVIQVKDSEGIVNNELSRCDHCFVFFTEKHPLLILVLFICAMFSLTIIISELGKK
jgi:hypothetical protein